MDIVERLREAAALPTWLYAEAADEITLWKQKAEVLTEMLDAAAKDADKAYALLRWAETEMRYAGWDKRINDQHGRTDVYEAIEEFL